MKIIKSIFYDTTSLLSINTLMNFSPVTSVFPYYHVISNSHLPHISNLYSYKNTDQFIADIDFLLGNFEPISLSELISHIEKTQDLPSKKFLLTFDDGYKEVYEIIAPILIKKGVPAVFFVNPAFINNTELFYRNKISLIIEQIKLNTYNVIKVSKLLGKSSLSLGGVIGFLKSLNQNTSYILDDIAREVDFSFIHYLNDIKPWMTTNQLFELKEMGFEIGAHSWNHPYYKLLTLQEQVQQTIESVEFLKETFMKCSSFSFPHSDADISQNFFDIVKNKCTLDLFFGIQNQKSELNNRVIHRFNADDPNLTMSTQVRGLFSWILIQQMINKFKVRRSNVKY